MDSPEVRYVKNGDVSIACSTLGDGPFDVVFVAGWILSVFETAWDGPAAETLRRLASFSRVILFDKRGTASPTARAAFPTSRRGWTTSAPGWTPSDPSEPPSSASARAGR